MDPHLVHVPRLATLSTRCLSRRDLEGLGRQANRALDAQVLGFGALKELGAYFFEGLHLAAREGDADLVDFLGGKNVSGDFFGNGTAVSIGDFAWVKQLGGSETGAQGQRVKEDVRGPRRNPSPASGKTC